MNMKKTALCCATGLSLGFAVLSAHAATFSAGQYLTANTGTPVYTGVDSNGQPILTGFTGSWFGMDTNADSAIANSEKTALAMGTQGLKIGVTQAAGGLATHGGCPTAGDTSNINAPWCFFGNTGKNYTTVAPTGNTTTGLNLSGWTVTWNGIPAINMGGGAWGTGFVNGTAKVTWDGVIGHSYILNYHATVPANDPSGFQFVKYALHLEGTVQQVPVPAAVWLLGSGLLGLVGVARRKKNA